MAGRMPLLEDGTMTKRNRSVDSLSAKVEKGIEHVRKAHSTGQEILEACPRGKKRREIYRKKLVQKQAESLGLSEELGRKARQLASGYTEPELKNLFALCREHHYVLGVSIVNKFLTIPKTKSQRAKFQEEAVKKNWTRARISAELRKRFGTRQKGGKKVKIAPDLEDALLQLEDWAYHVALMARKFDGALKQCAESPSQKESLKPVIEALQGAMEAASKVSEQAKGRQKRSARAPSGEGTAKTDGRVARRKKPATASSRSAARKTKAGQRDAGDAAELREYFGLS